MTRGSGYAKPGNWATLKAFVLERDGRTCYLCGGLAVTADHVLCVAHGGTHDLDNLAAICGLCHEQKTQREAAAGRARRSPTRPREAHPGLL